MYAVDDLGDAIDVTREFLTPVRKWMWLRLAVVVFFLSTFGGVPASPTNVSSVQQQPTEDVPAEELPTIDSELVPIIVGLVVVGIAIWLFFAAIASIMEFVLIASLRSGEVHVRRYGREHLGRAMRLFGFRIGLGLLVAAVIGGPLALIEFAGPGLGNVGFGLLAAFGLVAAVLFFAYLVVDKFTTEFVVPVMQLEDRGVLDAWGRFWPTLAGHKLEYAVYAILSVIVAIVLNIAVTIVFFLAFLVVLIPTVILGVIVFLLGAVGFVLAIPLAIAFLVVVVLLYGLLTVPVVAYLRYYALLVLGDTNDELDLIPSRRDAVRGGGDWDQGGPGSSPDSGDDGDDGWGTGWDDSDDAETSAGWDTDASEADDGGADRAGPSGESRETGGDESDESGSNWGDEDDVEEDDRW